MTLDPVDHGGALRAAMHAYPDAPQPWLDLSTGINPDAYPFLDCDPGCWTRLPERDDIADLETVAAAAYGTPDANSVVAAPGAQSVIQWLPHLFPARRVAVLGPTYAEHAYRWRRSGADVRTIAAVDEIGDAETVVVVNPNNPDGRVLSRDTLKALASRVEARRGLLVIDESFADVLPLASFVSEIGHTPAVVLRSFGKVHGLAGLRLGFAIAPRPIAEILRDAIGPWAVSGPAVAIGRRALADRAWRDGACRKLAEGATRLDRLLQETGWTIAGGTTLFRLARHEHAEDRHVGLCVHGILTRRFRAMPDRLRFGQPGTPDAWHRLGDALLAIAAAAR